MESPTGAHSDGHQHGNRKPTETLATEFCYQGVNLSLEELEGGGGGVGRVRSPLSEFSGSAPDSLKIRAQYNVEKFLPGIPGVFDTIASRGRQI